MSTMPELSAAVAELRKCGKAIIGVSEALNELFSSSGEAEEPIQKSAQPITLEEVRAVLAEKSVAGHRAEVQALIRECGVDKLSEVDPGRVPELKARAEVL